MTSWQTIGEKHLQEHYRMAALQAIKDRVFSLSLPSHTETSVVTLTHSHTQQSHTPTTTVSQRTHIPTHKRLRQQTHTIPPG